MRRAGGEWRLDEVGLRGLDLPDDAVGPAGIQLHARAALAGQPFTGDATIADHTDADDPASPATLTRLLDARAPVTGSLATTPIPLRPLLGTAAWVALPIAAGELDAGVLVLRARPGHPADEVDPAGVAATLVAQAATAYDRSQLFARVQALAVADELTGLANRRHFLEVARRDVETSSRADHPLAAAMVDIDHFKTVNDTHGHPTGDDVIRVVAQRLAVAVRDTDLVARYGGEEFAIILPGALPAYELPERLRTAVSAEPIPTRTGPIEVTISIGVAALTVGDDVDALLARADRALYQAKQGGRNRVCVVQGE